MTIPVAPGLPRMQDLKGADVRELSPFEVKALKRLQEGEDQVTEATTNRIRLLGSLRASFSDPKWSTPSTAFTGFAFAGIIYFIFCFGMSRYSLFVERRLNAHRRN